MTNVRTAAIIGGGIAGPVAALAMRRAGIEATIYEAYPGTADGVGGSLAIAPNGFAALEIVGVRQAVAAAARPISRTVMTVGRSRIQPPRLDDVGPLQLIQRMELYRALHDEALRQHVKIEYGKRLVSVEETATAVIATFADGSRTTADILVGADGVRSTVRTLIDPNAPGARYTGMLGFESHVDGTGIELEPDTMAFAFGKRGYYLYWPTAGNAIDWGTNLPYPRPMSLVEARAVPATDWMRELHTVYGAEVPGGELLRRTDPDTLQVTGALQIMPSVPHWYRGRLVLVGDAVHAPSNSSGQGASLAIESAIQLARCLRDLPDVPSAFAGYERLRRARVEKIAAAANRVNQAKAGPVVRALMPLLAPIAVKLMNPEKTLGPQQRYRIDWDAPVHTDRYWDHG